MIYYLNTILISPILKLIDRHSYGRIECFVQHHDITTSATGLSALIRVYKCSIPFTNILSDGLFIVELTSKTVFPNYLGRLCILKLETNLYFSKHF